MVSMNLPILKNMHVWRGSSVLTHLPEFYSILCLNHITFCVHTIIRLSIHLSSGTQLLTSVTLLWRYVSLQVCIQVPDFNFLSVYLGVKLQILTSCKQILFIVSRNWSAVLHYSNTIYISNSNAWWLWFPHILTICYFLVRCFIL